MSHQIFAHWAGFVSRRFVQKSGNFSCNFSWGNNVRVDMKLFTYIVFSKFANLRTVHNFCRSTSFHFFCVKVQLDLFSLNFCLRNPKIKWCVWWKKQKTDRDYFVHITSQSAMFWCHADLWGWIVGNGYNAGIAQKNIVVIGHVKKEKCTILKFWKFSISCSWIQEDLFLWHVCTFSMDKSKETFD